MLEQIANNLNQMFESDVRPIILNTTDSYLVMKCKFAKCNFQVWYKFEEKEGKKCNIAWFRTINHNHSSFAHQAGVIKDPMKSKHK